MKADAVLDYAEFAFSSSSRTRCELSVSAEGVREKVASGLVGQFSTHLAVLGEGIADARAVRLELKGGLTNGYHSSNGRRWFTKGTLERFARFVGTPEVLERPKSIEDEVAQLEQVRSIQANSFDQSRRCSGGDIDSDTKASRRDLLRAMEVRIRALRLEQESAIARARATGYDEAGIADLLAFADYFGANRLREACVEFISLSKKTVAASKEEVDFASSSRGSNPLEACDDVIRVEDQGGLERRGIWGSPQAYVDERRFMHENQSNNQDLYGNNVRGEVCNGIDGELHLHLTDTPPKIEPLKAKSPRDSARSSYSCLSVSDGLHAFASACWQGGSVHDPLLQSKSTSSSNHISEATPEKHLDSNRSIRKRAQSPRRRLASPLRRVQIGRSGRRTGSFVIANADSNSKISAKGSDSTDSEVESSDENPVSSVARHLRRFSVQDAISLFEGKRKESSKQEPRRLFVEGGNAPPPLAHGNNDILETSIDREEVPSSLKEIMDPKGLSDLNFDGNVLETDDSDEWVATDAGFVPDLEEMQSKGLANCYSRGNGFDVDSSNESDLAMSKERESIVKQESSDSPIDGKLDMPGESWGSSWNKDAFHNFDIQALVGMVDIGNGDSSSQESRGRLYEQYRKLRDAKLREEKASKRAEREAKLKSMEETLERRKAEMEARNSSSALKRNELRSLRKAQSPQAKESPENDYKVEEPKVSGHQEPADGSSRPSSPVALILVGITGQLPQTQKNGESANKKAIPSELPQKPPLIASASPKQQQTKKGANGNQGATNHHHHRRSGVSQLPNAVVDNPLARSVPCLADLRKENTKPSPGRAASGVGGVVRAPPRSGNGNNVNSASKLLANGNVGDKKRRSMLTRKSCASSAELEALSSSQKEVVVEAAVVIASMKKKGQRETTTTTAAAAGEKLSLHGRIRRNAVAPIQEAKPFLRKGRGIGPGTGPGVVKLLKAAAAEATKTCSDEGGGGEQDSPSSPLVPSVVAIDDNQLEIANDHVNEPLHDCIDDLLCEVKGLSDPSQSQEEPNDHVLLGLNNKCGGNDPQKLEESGSMRKELPDFDRTIAPILLELPPETKDQSNEGITVNTEVGASFMATSSSFPSNEHSNKNNNTTTVLASPSILSASQLHSIIPGHEPNLPSVATLDSSPTDSHTSWNSTQANYYSLAETARHAKKQGGSQKPVLVVTQSAKEPVKGFKRLLKFGRKNRSSEATSSDSVSVSTPSEGDAATDEQRKVVSRSSDDLFSAIAHGSRTDHGNKPTLGDLCGIRDQATTISGHSLRSSIPVPPVNFKPREDRSSGGSLLKAPRSFFSLSTFRSKGSDGKSQ